MKKLLLVACAIICSIFYASAQQLEDVVYLKNGSIIRGVITEQIPGKSIKIQTLGGSLFIYQISEVDRMTKEPVQTTKQKKQPRVKPAIDWSIKYSGEVNIGYAITGERFKWKAEYFNSEGKEMTGWSHNVMTVFSRPLFETVHGIEIGPYFFVGAGVGLQYYCGRTKAAQELFSLDDVSKYAKRWNAVMLPIFTDIKFMYPTNKGFTPFINLGLGGTIGCHSAFDYNDSGSEGIFNNIIPNHPADFVDWEVALNARGGFYCDFGAGFRYKLLNVGVGLQHQVFKMVYTTEKIYRKGTSVDYHSVESCSTKINAFYVKVGVNF